MTSSLSGLYTAQRSILLNQAALDVVGNNIANVNTDGYSKQTINTSQITILGDNTDPMSAAQAGAGATIDSVTRNRDTYLDAYYRKENSTSNYYSQYSSTAKDIENITNELSNSGNLTTSLNNFYTAAQSLSSKPTDLVSRTNFVQQSSNVASEFNSESTQLTALRKSLVGDGTDPTTLNSSTISTTCTDLNTKLKSLADLNKSISLSATQGSTPNGLLDQRDLLLDNISKDIPITVTQCANNTVNVSLGNYSLVNGSNVVSTLKTSIGDSTNPAVVSLIDSNNNTVLSDASSLLTSGTVGAILDVGGSDPNKLTINGYIQNLNTLAQQFATQVNSFQESGKYINNSTTPQTLVASPAPVPPAQSTSPAYDLFVESSTATQATMANLTAANITVNQNIVNDPYKVAAASSTATASSTGDGSNALSIAESQDTKVTALSNQTIEGFVTSLNGTMGIQIQTITDNNKSQSTILSQVKQQRQSASGVSLDEELSDLIKYQTAYEASAKVLTTINTALQSIISMVS